MTISVIVPTIGRPESLTALLISLSEQTVKPDEVIIADGSGGEAIAGMLAAPQWRALGLSVTHVPVFPPNAVRQRKAAIARASGEFLLLLDDDVVLEEDCTSKLLGCIRSSSDVVGVMADFNNQTWSMPTTAWRWYLRYWLRMGEGQWQGRVVGPLLRFGFNPVPQAPCDLEWLGAGISLVKRSSYHQSGGFSDFFLHRCTVNEDVDLGLKLSRVGRILFCPSARMAHHHAPGGRLSVAAVAEDDLYNRYFVMRFTQGMSCLRAFGQAMAFYIIETASNFAGAFLRCKFTGLGQRLTGRSVALIKIMCGIVTGRYENAFAQTGQGVVANNGRLH